MNRQASASRRSGRRGALVLLGTVLAVLPALAHADGPAGDGPGAARVRQPVALCLSRDGTRLFLANRRAGSISVIDTSSARVVAEHHVGRGLADLAALPDGAHLLALDQAAGALLLIATRGDAAQVVSRLEIGPDPVSVLVAPDGSTCAVASSGPRRLTFCTLSPAPRVAWTLDLPFSPRHLAQVRGGAKLVVADTFGGRLAVVDVRKGVLDAVRSLPAHNIRGLAATPDGETLVVAHQTLRSTMKSDFEDVHWGRLMSSQLRSVRVDALLAPGTDDDLLRGGSVVDLGFAGEGASDPAALACDSSGGVAVALGGVDQVALGRSPSSLVRRVGVGQRPSAVAFGPDDKTVYVADTFADTVSVVDVVSGRRERVISLGPRPEPTLVERGERLFYDALLSHDGWMSCHSCHTDGHTNGRLADTPGDGSYGAPKLIPSLLGVGATAPWAWNGSVDRLEDQVRKSIERTMRGDTTSDDKVEALTAYLRSLRPPPAAPDTRSVAEARGRDIFRSRKCAGCHAAPEYTAAREYDVGLVDEVGNRRFNPPSLRGLGARAPLLHDGRAATLDDVFLKHRHPRGSDWTADDVRDLAAFLRTL